MVGEEAVTPAGFKAEARSLLDSIARARDKIEDLPGVLDGTLDRFRDRIDRLIRESEVETYRQIRIFQRDLDQVAADLAKAVKDKRLASKHILVLDACLRKMKKRDFYGARKQWHKLDGVAGQAAEVRRLNEAYREAYREVDARIRSLSSDADRLAGVPRPPASPEDAVAFDADIDAFNADADAAYLDFLARAPIHRALPILLETSERTGVGIPAPPRGSDPEPLLTLLADEDPARDSLRARSFYGLLELPGYSDAKLTHLMGDARTIRGALDAAWPWLRAIRDEERRCLHIEWSDDVGGLRTRMPALARFLARIAPEHEAKGRAEAFEFQLASGRFETLQAAARLYGRHGQDAVRQWKGELAPQIAAMRKESADLAAALKEFPEPERVKAGALR